MRGGRSRAPADRPEDDSFGTKAAEEAKEAASGKRGPFVHGKAKRVAEFHLVWPDDIAEHVPGAKISPLAVHYIRIEENNRLIKLAGLYQHQLKGSTNRQIDNGRWIDFFDEGAMPHSRRSVDVLITSKEKKKPNTPRPANRNQPIRPKTTPEDIIVEILSIEGINPRYTASQIQEPRKEPKETKEAKDSKEKSAKPRKPATTTGD